MSQNEVLALAWMGLAAAGTIILTVIFMVGTRPIPSMPKKEKE